MWKIDGRAVVQGLRMWTVRQTLVAAGVAGLVGVLIGVATVLIPNPVFTRDIPPVWWDVPVLILMAVLTGMLAATYVRDGASVDSKTAGGTSGGSDASGAESRVGADGDGRGGLWGIAGTVLAWFAVGCPVCNKIALLALGYTGALTYFAPLQPILALVALGLTSVALLWRLQGRVICPLPRRATAGA